jgi:hypothetical protein
MWIWRCIDCLNLNLLSNHVWLGLLGRLLNGLFISILDQHIADVDVIVLCVITLVGTTTQSSKR